MKIQCLAALAGFFLFLPMAQADSFRALALGTLGQQAYQGWLTFDFINPTTVDVYLDNPQSETEFRNQSIAVGVANGAIASYSWAIDSSDAITFSASAPGNFNSYWQAGVTYDTNLPLYVGDLNLTALKYATGEVTVASPTAVAPEPGIFGLTLAGMVGILFGISRKRRTAL